MKRKYLIVLTLFSALVFTMLKLSQLHAELTLGEAATLLNNKITVLNGYISTLNTDVVAMKVEEKAWESNEEDIMENRIDYASADLWGLGGAVLKQIMDMQDRAEIAASLGAAIGSVQTSKSNADTAASERDRVWDEYERLADAARISPSERLSKGQSVPDVSYPNVSISCPDCPASWSGSSIGGISSHITSCSVKGHTNSSGDLVSDSLPHFTCQTCPLAHQHYTFVCRRVGCDELFPQPTGEDYHDDGYFCNEPIGLLSTCGRLAFKCQTPECDNDDNHLIKADCGNHKVKKSDTAELAKHKPVGQSCPETYTYPSGRVISCLIYIAYKCDEHSIHDYDPGPGTNPPPEVLDNTPNCDYCTDGCSICTPKVVCPADAWTNCGGTKSHATTCGAGHSYYTCNPAAVQAHDWHTGCPADAWTNCGGLTSHAKECGRGHWYYTCNPAAVQAHSWH